MKIVVLDGVPLNAGDLDWSDLNALGDVTIFDNTSPEQVRERIADVEAVFTNKVKLPREVLQGANSLRFIGVLATGYDVVDIEAARERGITVCNVPSYSADFTAQSAIALLLELTHHLGAHDAAVRDGAWQRSGYFSFWNFPLIELSGKTMVIVGLGNIGKRVAKIADALGMKVLAADLPGRESQPKSRDESTCNKENYPRLPLDEALSQADVISLHCPLTPQTRQLLNAELLSKLSASTLIVNNARGLLIDEQAMADALHENRIGGYATDVLSSEPPAPDNPLLNAPNCIIVPHLSWASIDSRQRLLQTSVENLRAFQEGTPQNVVS